MYTTQQLDRARHLAYKNSGIVLGSNKDIMISNRLDRLKRLDNNENIDEILKNIEDGKNIDKFISAFTTNKTNFFREAFHFDDLKNRIIQEAIENKSGLKIYCSAASTGEEPYSILMTIEYVKRINNIENFNYTLLATDIDLEVLEHCKKGIYEYSKLEENIPNWIKPSEYFKRRIHPEKNGDYLIKIKDILQRKVQFQQFNLMSAIYPFKANEFDVVFCRNVLIYFSQDDQKIILKNLIKTLKIGGTLYLGHSESPLNLSPYIKRCGQNIFIKTKEFL
jgi:chemotaxis protein methyltransferase CheR